MAGIIAGSLLVGLAALMAARALASLSGLTGEALQAMAVPLSVWLVMSGLLILLVPQTSLIESGHQAALLAVLAGNALICLPPVARFLLARRAGRSLS